MEEKANNNVINNYKGVMLCSRPNEVNQVQTQKPFCARVVVPEQIGLVPCAQDKPPRQEKKKTNQILNKHKKWLQQFKQYQNQKKEGEEMSKLLEQEKFKKIKQQAQEDRQRSRKMKQQYNQTATNVLNILDDKPVNKKLQLNSENLKRLNEANDKQQQKDEQFKKNKKKGDKPAWAQSQKQYEAKQEEEVNELINFFDTNPVQQFSEDQQVQQILKHLKQKIEKLKEQDNWKENQVKKIKNKSNQLQKEEKDQKDDDKYSHFSVQSDGKSIASEKTQKKIQELREKLEKKKQGQQEWDKHTTTSKQSANIQDKIVKNLADQVLRNYPNLRGVHSNTSIRKLLQAQAAKAIFQPINRPVITTIVRQKIPLDSSNLPYLHRNPAI